MRAEVSIKPIHNVCIKQQKYIIKNTLQTIVDKCLFYGQVGVAEGQGRRISTGKGFELIFLGEIFKIKSYFIGNQVRNHLT